MGQAAVYTLCICCLPARRRRTLVLKKIIQQADQEPKYPVFQQPHIVKNAQECDARMLHSIPKARPKKEFE